MGMYSCYLNDVLYIRRLICMSKLPPTVVPNSIENELMLCYVQKFHG